MKKEFATHYLNPKTRKFACENRYGDRRRFNQFRLWTENKSEVDCKHCLDQLKKWDEINKRKGDSYE